MPEAKLLRCPDDGNTRSWRNVSTGPGGTIADCGVCGRRVDDPTITSVLRLNIASTDSTTFGDGASEVNHS